MKGSMSLRTAIKPFGFYVVDLEINGMVPFLQDAEHLMSPHPYDEKNGAPMVTEGPNRRTEINLFDVTPLSRSVLEKNRNGSEIRGVFKRSNPCIRIQK